MPCLLLPLVRGLVVATMFMLAMTAGAADVACPPACKGQTLTTPNFSHQDLANADFEGATIVGGVFIRANLAGAKFTNARFQGVESHPTQTPDFTFANLTNATFVGATFSAPTYFTYATLTCADFSQTNLANGNAVFGDEPLIYTYDRDKPDACRIKFQATTMNCEFINDWRNFDLGGANVRACLRLLAKRDFSYAMMPRVDFSGAYLAGVNFSHAQMHGANLSRANLTGANMGNVFLSTGANGTGAAILESAHLKNVNLSKAQLSGVNFTNANFYGTNAANSSQCAIVKGFAQECATAKGATITGTSFTGAYLYGVEFTNAHIKGATFTGAVLTGANFAGATVEGYPGSGAATLFSQAHLQGTNLATTMTGVDMTDAFLDFGSGGNGLAIMLSGSLHNAFACGPSPCAPATGSDVCVAATYNLPTSVPAGNATIICPDGTTGNCGVAGAAGWKSSLSLKIGTAGNGTPQGWYQFWPASYTPQANSKDVCNGAQNQPPVFPW